MVYVQLWKSPILSLFRNRCIHLEQGALAEEYGEQIKVNFNQMNLDEVAKSCVSRHALNGELTVVKLPRNVMVVSAFSNNDTDLVHVYLGKASVRKLCLNRKASNKNE